MYDHPSQAEPFLPPFDGPLLELAQRVSRQALDLMDKVPSALHVPLFEETLRSNANYSNRIENEEREEYLLAHIQAERALDVIGPVGVPALGSAVLRDMHRALFSGPDESTFAAGQWRSLNVQVQSHVPPRWEAVPRFLERADQVYLRPTNSAAELLLVIAAAHHRMTWIHPLIDGNGRTVRLQSQLALRPFGSYFWSLSHGLWRRLGEYYRTLREADEHRLGDLDGRGNLSQRRLVAWCSFFVIVCEEEIQAAAQRIAAESTKMF